MLLGLPVDDGRSEAHTAVPGDTGVLLSQQLLADHANEKA